MMKKETNKNYINNDVELAISQYCSGALTEQQKNILYTKTIYPAFHKLVENIIHDRKLFNYGIDSYKIIKSDCVTHLTLKLNNYNPSKGKVFSLFNRIAINYLVANKKLIEKRRGRTVDSSTKTVISTITNKSVNFSKETESQNDLKIFCSDWANWGIEKLEILYPIQLSKKTGLPKQNKKNINAFRDRKIAEAIFNLFKNVDYIDIYNKKALLLYIREQVNVDTAYITPILKELKELFYYMYESEKNKK